MKTFSDVFSLLNLAALLLLELMGLLVLSGILPISKAFPPKHILNRQYGAGIVILFGALFVMNVETEYLTGLNIWLRLLIDVFCIFMAIFGCRILFSASKEMRKIINQSNDNPTPSLGK